MGDEQVPDENRYEIVIEASGIVTDGPKDEEDEQ